jgi:hypothetical protein
MAGWLDFIGVVDASSHGVGGVIIGELSECLPTVFRLQWPPDITANVKSEANPKGTITNSDLELLGLVLLWLMMEHVCELLTEKRIALFSDNSPTVSWVEQMACRSSRSTVQHPKSLSDHNASHSGGSKLHDRYPLPLIRE